MTLLKKFIGNISVLSMAVATTIFLRLSVYLCCCTLFKDFVAWNEKMSSRLLQVLNTNGVVKYSLLVGVVILTIFCANCCYRLDSKSDYS